MIFIFALSSCGQSGDTQTYWRSKHRVLSFNYTRLWHRLPTLDTKEETLSGVIDYTDGKSYIVKIADDVPKAKLTNEQFYAEVKNLMLDPNTANRVVLEDDTTFHSQPAHRIVFFMNTDKWGLMKQVNYIKRDGREFVSVQILYPIKEGEADKSIPDAIIRFDKSVLINR